MPFTVTLRGQFLKFVDSDNTKPEYEFPLSITATLFDDAAQAVELSCGKLRLYFTASEISSPVLANYTALKTQLDAWKTSAGNVVTVGKFNGPIADSFTRPNDNNAYAAGDAIQNATSAPAVRRFVNLFPAGGGSGYLSVYLWVGNVNPTARIRMHLFSDLPTVRANDNAAFAVNSDDAPNYLGYIDFEALNNGVAVGQSRKEIVCNGTDLWYDLQTLDAFTPAINTAYRPTAILDSNI